MTVSAVEFALKTPTKLTREQYVAYIDSAPFPALVFSALKNHQVQEAREAIRRDPDFNINCKNQRENGQTLLHLASEIEEESFIRFLLSHRAINVNQRDKTRLTPFQLACKEKRTQSALLLLGDSRLRIEEPPGMVHPLWQVTVEGQIDVAEAWIASGKGFSLRDTDRQRLFRELRQDTFWVGEETRRRKHAIIALLDNYISDPYLVRNRLRKKLSWYHKVSADAFSHVVFICDGLLKIKDGDTGPTARFFTIACTLPLDLQAVLCYRLADSAQNIIPPNHREAGFKSLARALLTNQPID